MKYNFLILAVLIALSVPIVSADDPYANFTPASISGVDPVTVVFEDYSYGAVDTYSYTMTNVTSPSPTPIVFSSISAPTYTFHNGNWSVQLTVTNVYGSNTSRANAVFVNVSGAATRPSASFTKNQTTVYPGQPVQFTDTSTGNPTSWQWRSGPAGYADTVSTEQNPVLYFDHTDRGSIWQVTLVVSNSAGGDESLPQTITVIDPPVGSPAANFTPRGTYNVEHSRWGMTIENGTAVTFYDTSTNISASSTFNWSFWSTYVGHIRYNTRNVTIEMNASTFGTAESSMSHWACNEAGCDVATAYFSVHRPPVVPIPNYYATRNDSYGINVQAGSPDRMIINPGQSVYFEDLSYNSPTARTWTIDAGNGSHYFYYTPTVDFAFLNASEGALTINLTVSNDDGSVTLSRSDVFSIGDTTLPNTITNLAGYPGVHALQWAWTPSTSADIELVEEWKDGVLISNLTPATRTSRWENLTSSTSYSIGLRAKDTSGNYGAFTNATVSTTGTSWAYTTTSGYVVWTCPIDVASVSANLDGGGSSGGSAYLWTSLIDGHPMYYAGSAGVRGANTGATNIVVVPNRTYPIWIGRGGNQTNATAGVVGSLANNGEATTAFGLTAAGGINLHASTGFTGNGLNGAAGAGTARLSGNGTDSAVYTGGIGGLGNAAGGGGGAAAITDGAYQGGMGANGSVTITASGYTSGLNRPDFSADRTTGTPGTLIHFTDLSQVVDYTNLTYNWSFGDGTYSSEQSDVHHVFAYLGSYDIKLVLSTDNGTATELKSAYINIVKEDPGKINSLYPSQFKFTLIDKKGRLLPNVAVTAVMTSSSLDNTDWLSSLFGAADATPINSTMLYDTSDEGGTVVFTMIQSGRYQMNFTEPSRGISETRVIHPTDATTLLFLSTTTDIVANLDDDIKVNISAASPATPTIVYLNATYLDLSSTTTDAYFYVLYANQTPVYIEKYTGSYNISESYAVTNTAGVAYVWGINSTTTKYGQTDKAMGITLAGTGENGMANNLIRVGCTNWKCD